MIDDPSTTRISASPQGRRLAQVRLGRRRRTRLLLRWIATIAAIIALLIAAWLATYLMDR
jgi:hypothetical protein